MSNILIVIIIAISAYLIGSISPGIMLTNKEAHVDIRDYGSKSSGATNVMRVMGKKLGVSVFLLDIIKGIIACTIGSLIMGRDGGVIAGLFAVIGHNWPLYFKFKGGKGVATSGAVIVWMFPIFGSISIVACILIIALTHFVSVGSMSMLVIFTILMWIFHSSNIYYCIWATVLMAMCLYKHRTNIKRLIAGQENKLGHHVNIKDSKQ